MGPEESGPFPFRQEIDMKEQHDKDGCSIWFSVLRRRWILSFGNVTDLPFDTEQEAIDHAKAAGMKWRWTAEERWEPIR